MAYRVVFSADAEADLDEILAYVAENDGDQRAGTLILALQSVSAKLADLPNRGGVLKDFRSIEAIEYREVHYKPYRIIYEIIEGQVIIHAVIDGRRDMETLLRQRLLR